MFQCSRQADIKGTGATHNDSTCNIFVLLFYGRKSLGLCCFSLLTKYCFGRWLWFLSPSSTATKLTLGTVYTATILQWQCLHSHVWLLQQNQSRVLWPFKVQHLLCREISWPEHTLASASVATFYYLNENNKLHSLSIYANYNQTFSLLTYTGNSGGGSPVLVEAVPKKWSTTQSSPRHVTSSLGWLLIHHYATNLALIHKSLCHTINTLVLQAPEDFW